MRSYRAELLRCLNRSTVALLALCVAVGAFAMLNAGPQHQVPLWGFQQAAIFIATLLMGRAAVTAATDFSAGTIRAWLISAPSRGTVFLGKVAASITVTLAGCAVVGLAALAVSCALGTIPTPGVFATMIEQLAIAAAGLTFFGHAAGVATRSVPIALTVTLGWILPAEAVLEGRSATFDAWLPGNLLHDISLGQIPPNTTMLGASLHGVIPFLVLDMLALLVFLRRDVTA